VQAPTTPTTLSMTATVTAETPDPETTNNRAARRPRCRAIARPVGRGVRSRVGAFGDTFSYTLGVGNLGQRCHNVVLTDLLPEGVQSHIRRMRRPRPCPVVGGTVRFDLGTIRAGDFVTVFESKLRAHFGRRLDQYGGHPRVSEDANWHNNSAPRLQTTDHGLPPLSTVGRVRPLTTARAALHD